MTVGISLTIVFLAIELAGQLSGVTMFMFFQSMLCILTRLLGVVFSCKI